MRRDHGSPNAAQAPHVRWRVPNAKAGSPSTKARAQASRVRWDVPSTEI